MFVREVIYEPDPDAATVPWSPLGEQIDDDADDDPDLPNGRAVARLTGRLARVDSIDNNPIEARLPKRGQAATSGADCHLPSVDEADLPGEGSGVA